MKRTMICVMTAGTILLAGIAGLPAHAAPASQATLSRYERALEQLEAGQPQAARILLKALLRDEPGLSPARLLLGEIYLRQGDGASAEKELKRARQSGGDAARILPALGAAYLLQSKNQTVLEEIPGPDGPPEIRAALLSLRGQAYLNLNRLDEAERAFRLARSLSPDGEGPLLGLAQVAARRGRYGEALGDLDQALGRSLAGVVVRSSAWRLKGDILRRQGKTDDALEAYGAALEVNRRNVAALLSRAALLADLHQFDTAQADIDAAFEIAPMAPQAAFLKSIILRRQGNSAAARRALEETALVLKNALDAHFGDVAGITLMAGTVAFALERDEEAINLLRRYILLNPGDANGYKLLGAALLRQGDPVRATERLVRARTLAPHDAGVLAYLGQAEMARGRFGQAIDSFREAVGLAPDDAPAHRRLGAAYYAARQYDKALAALRRARQIDPFDVRAGALMVAVLARQSRSREAVAAARDLVARNPDDAPARLLLGSVLLNAGEHAAARDAFAAAAARDAGAVTPRLNLAALARTEQRWADAEAHDRSVLAIAPDQPQALLGMARTRFAQGDRAGARQWYEKARTAHPDLAEPWLGLADLASREGKSDQALALLDGYLAKHPGFSRGWDIKGRLLLHFGRPLDAEDAFEKAVGTASKERRPEALYRLALAQLRIPDRRAARQSLHRAIAARPSWLDACLALVKLEIDDGAYDEALKLVAKIAALRPDGGLADRLRGEILLRRGRYSDAARAYEASRQAGATFETVWGLSRVRLAQGAPEQGARLLQGWIAGHPGDVRAQRALASHYIAANDPKRALVVLEALRAAGEESVFTLNNLAWAYGETGDPRALGLAQRAYGKFPRAPAVLDTLAWLLIGQGKAERGLALLRNATLLHADDPVILYHTAVALEALGRRPEAKILVGRALAVGGAFRDAAAARTLYDRLARISQEQP
jgi:putative PEP-CTERM system TPR-repeat lipoprotein